MSALDIFIYSPLNFYENDFHQSILYETFPHIIKNLIHKYSII